MVHHRQRFIRELFGLRMFNFVRPQITQRGFAALAGYDIRQARKQPMNEIAALETLGTLVSEW